MGFIGSSLSDVHFFFGDHGFERLQVRPIVPWVSHLRLIYSQVSESYPTQDASHQRICSKNLSRIVSWLQIGKIMNEPLIRDDRHPTLVPLSLAPYVYCQGPCQDSPYRKVCNPGKLILSFYLPLILPGPSLGSRHVLSETGSDPRVMIELILQPIRRVIRISRTRFLKSNLSNCKILNLPIHVVDFVLSGGLLWRSQFKHIISLPDFLKLYLIFGCIEAWLRILKVIAWIKLAWHNYWSSIIIVALLILSDFNP